MITKSSELFHGTAWYYSRYRPQYPQSVFDRLEAAFHLNAETTILDVGCGTGQLSIPLAKKGISVVAIDPSPEMLTEAKIQETNAGVARPVTWIQGNGEELSSLVRHPARLAVFGASIHWMDRDLVLKQCDGLIDAQGGVALLLSPSTWNQKTDWAMLVREVIQQFLGSDRRAGSGTYTTPSERHDVVLARSPFNRIETWKDEIAITRTVDEVIGLQYSTSYCSPTLLGDNKEAFETMLRQRLLELNPENQFVEQYTIETLIGRRP
ncbi:methyltransferase domain-containing protein [Candidatus Uhrbacteria bacterium]|nr:methyltransferase domain-containing protein [Candidatus Uhrbacteria bacterium]